MVIIGFPARLFGLIVLVLVDSFSVTGQSLVPEDLRIAVEHVDAMARDEFDKDNLGSVTVGIVDGSNLIWTGSYGHADMEGKVTADRETIYRVGAITKQVTALMLLQLSEQDIVRLSDPVEIYFPEINRVNGRIPDSPPITLIQLATMTAGLAREPENVSSLLKGIVPEWEEVLIAALSETSYAHEPDTRHLDSNIGYGVLGVALGRAVGEKFVDYISERIFAPLGMTSSGFKVSEVTIPKLAKGYRIEAGEAVGIEMPANEHGGRAYKLSSEGLYMDTLDLSTFLSFALGYDPGNILSNGSWAENLERVNSANGDLSSGYGIGFQLTRRGDLVFHGHDGSAPGYSAAAHINRRTDLGVTVLRNVGGGAFNVSDLCLDVLEVLARARLGGAGGKR